jgi:hypothetical protein
MASLLTSCFGGGAGTREAAASSEPLLRHEQQNPLLQPRRPSPIPRRRRDANANENHHHPTTPTQNDDAPGPDLDFPPDVWVLAGQSNCTGWNGPDGTELDPLPSPPDAGVLMLSPDGTALVRAREPTHLDVWGFSDRQTVGPGLSFARALRQGCALRGRRGRENRPVVLVPCARGGSSLCNDWSPDADDGDGTALDTRSGSLFGNCVRRTLRAVELATVVAPSGGVSGGGGGGSQRGRPRLRGVVWVQGESDGFSEASARAYVYNFANFLGRLREELGAGLKMAVDAGSALAAPSSPRPAPVLPIVLMVVMAAREREKAFPFIRIVREEQLWIAAKAAEDREMRRRRRWRQRGAQDNSGSDDDNDGPPPPPPFSGVRALDMAGFEFFPDGGSATARSTVAVDGNLVHLTKDGAAALGTALGLLGAAAEAEEEEEEARRRRR